MTRKALTSLALTLMCFSGAMGQSTETWRYYRPSNTGIQGDFNEALYIGPDGDPWIGGFDASFEEGGIAKLVRAENRWINVSNVNYPVIGHPQEQGCARVSEIVADASGVLWMATGHGVLKYDPAMGPASLQRYFEGNSLVRGGWVEAVEIAPNGDLWFSAYTTVWGDGGMYRYVPSTDIWTRWEGPRGSIATQPKPGGGYYVWCAETGLNGAGRFDSTTGVWTNFPRAAGAPGEALGPKATDDAGNVWMYRFDNEFSQRLNCRRPDGTWINPPLPPLIAVTPAVWALRAYGNGEVLLVDGASRVWEFDATTWHDRGIWREGMFTSDVIRGHNGEIWACGTGGAAVRNPTTGQWQRYRVTNTSQFDFFNNDLTIDPVSGDLFASANAGSGFGGMVRFDGTRWTGYNQAHYGLGIDWPFNTDNSRSIHMRPNGTLVVNPMFGSTHQLSGGAWSPIPGGSASVVSYRDDSLGRLWGLGEYFNLGIYQAGGFGNFEIASQGQKMLPDPVRPGTVWANAGYEVARTDGSYRFSRTIDDYPQLTSQSDTFSGLAVAPDGTAWVGCTVMFGAGGTGGGLVHINPTTGTSTMMTYEGGWPLPGQFVQPLAVTPDGRLWMQYDSQSLVAERGLCWYDGTSVGVFPAPPGGGPQWGGLPHAQIVDLEVKLKPDGYELWMSCASRGIAVLSVTVNQACSLADIAGGGTDGVSFDGTVDGTDFIAFINSFSIGDPSVDPLADVAGGGADAMQPDGTIDGADFIAFINAFAAGC